mmetsp:Transcript_7330/g.15274  ORF Transcript_7330/g.15274 Transcript_7330/m.15274 type:complete len:256 (-) Transcript_7330:201-968(-)
MQKTMRDSRACADNDENDIILPPEKRQVVMEPMKTSSKGTFSDDEAMFDHSNQEPYRRRVGFAPQVSVKEIPGRLDYSDSVRSSYWADKKEMSKMTERNMIEFAAEGWDWRNATDDEQMLILNGEAVHPVHSNPYLRDALQRQIPYPRAVTPPDEERSAIFEGFCAMQCDPPDRGAVTPEAEEMERPSSPFVESVVLDETMQNYDENLLLNDPDQFLRQRFAASPHHRPRQDIPFGDSEDAYFNKVLNATNNLKI